MKKTLFIFIAMLICSCIAFSQLVPGTVKSVGGDGSRNITANGLTELFSVTGNYTLSADGAGSNNADYTIDINKPNSGATVYKAYLLCAPVWQNTGNCTQLNSIPITWDGSSNAAWGCCNYYADVTTIVTAFMVGAPVGISSIPLNECDYIDGYALLVIFSDPLTFQKTIVIMFGGLSTSGDNFSITLSQPIDPSASGAFLDMGLGISFSYQVGGTQQYSIVDINGQRLTTAAGGADDAQTAISNGDLLTVGGLGDSDANPVNPFDLTTGDYFDDELYSLLPLITNTTTSILVNTLNPSNDDNVFLSYFEISGAAIIGEGILISQTADTNIVGSNHTVTALVQDVTGGPVVGTLVDFTVLSGPNAGTTHSEVTNASGNAFFTYAGTGGAGTDVIQACFINSQQVNECSNTLNKVWITSPFVPISNWAIVLGIMLIISAAAFRFRRLL